MFAKSKKKKSILVLAILFFWAAYVSIVSGQYYYNVSRLADQRIGDRKKTLSYVSEFSAGLLIQDNLEHLKDRLDQARELNLIDFYILQKNSDVVMFYNSQNNVDDLNMDYKNFNVVMETPDVAFKTLKIFDYRLTLGIITNKAELAWTMAAEQKYLIMHDFVMVTLFLGVILFMLLKDIINLSKIVTTRNRGEMQNLKSLSKEGQALLNATSTYESTQQVLKSEKEFFADSLTPAILHEIRSGTPSPSSFASTMVRIDLNGYTQLYLEKKEEYVTSILNRYFVAAREVIERYGGLVYQYVGDEVVFHFKGPRERTEPVAVACVRSLFELAEEIESSLPAEAGHYFKLKASMASGTILFVKLDTGFALSGIPLIESARLLSQVDDKSKNSMAVYESAGPHISVLCRLSEPKEGILKGFAGTTRICQILEFKARDQAYAEDMSLLATYFRSDRDLEAMLVKLGSIIIEKRDDVFFSVVLSFKRQKNQVITAGLEAAFTQFLNSCYEHSKTGDASFKAMAAAVSLATTIIPKAKGGKELSQALSQFLIYPHPRVQANTVTALSEVSAKNVDFKEFIHSENNRLAADALVVTGLRGLEKDLVVRIKHMLSSSDAFHRASGLYVVRRLLQHYDENDKVYYNSNPHIRELEELLARKSA